MENAVYISFLNPDNPEISQWKDDFMEHSGDCSIEFVSLESMPQEGRNILFVAGGDGSLNHAINELMTKELNDKLEILYFPSGTGNDFSRAIGLHKKSKQEIIELLSSGSSSEMKVGKMDETYFINMASCGMFAEVTPEVDPELKGFLGSWSYYFKGIELLADIKTTHCEFNIDGETLVEKECIGFFVANGRFSGGGVQIISEASPFESSLGLLIVRDAPLTSLISLGLELQKEKPDISEFDVIHKKIQSFEFRSKTPISLSLDGEKLSQKAGKFRLSHGQVKILTP